MKPPLTHEEALEKLQQIGQAHLLAHFQSLSEHAQDHLLQKIGALDSDLYLRQRTYLEAPPLSPPPFEPFTAYDQRGNSDDYKQGEELMREGKCGCLVLAGGQGSRLRFKGPKGTFPISPVKHKSLFQLVAERVVAASKQVGYDLPIAVMTSPLTHVETETFFIQHAFFGLKPDQITFFRQKMWPLLNEEGELFLETPGKIARGPNGNGGVFRHFVEKGIWEKWEKQGIEMVSVIAVDNPLALPFDAEFFGYHWRMKDAATLKTALRRDPKEKVGIVALVEGKPHIIEYTELKEHPDEPVANLGLYCFSMPFLKEASEVSMPLHRAKKAVPYLGEDGETHLPEEPNAWKFEEFIFDVLPLADRCHALLYPREECFAPLKNFQGEDSIETVREALMAYERKIFAQISGTSPPPDRPLELSAAFYYPTEDLRAHWRNKSLPETDYIEEP